MGRRRYPNIRRGKIIDFTRSDIGTSSVIDKDLRTQVLVRIPRRGKLIEVPKPVVVVQPPAYPFSVTDPSRTDRLQQFINKNRSRTPSYIPSSQLAPQDDALRPRVKSYKPRRPQVILPPWPQSVTPPPPYIPLVERIRVKPGLRKTGKTINFIPTQTVVVPPAFIPQTIRERVKYYNRKNGKLYQSPIDQTFIIPTLRERVKVYNRKTGKLIQFIPAQVVVTPPSFVPLVLRERVKPALKRTGRVIQTVPTPTVVVPPSYTPQVVQEHVKRYGLRRAKVLGVIPQAHGHIVFNSRIKIKPAILKKSHIYNAVNQQGIVLPFITHRTKPIKKFKGQVIDPPRLIVLAPPFVPFVERMRVKNYTPKRGKLIATPWGQALAILSHIEYEFGKPVFVYKLSSASKKYTTGDLDEMYENGNFLNKYVFGNPDDKLED